MKQNIIKFAKNIFVSLLAIYTTMGILELLWFTWLSAGIYQSEMSGLLRESFIPWPWIVFYMMYGAITFVLAIVPNRDKVLYYASIDGALLGLASYGAYNLTNYSIIEGFSLSIMLIDWAWGTFLTMSIATAGLLAFKMCKSR